jgi:arylsulfatase A-like enzyme
LVHVPLVIRVPGISVHSRVKLPFSLLDLAPTALDIVGVPGPADFRGRSVWGQLRNGRLQQRPVLSECVFDCSNPFYPGHRLGPRILSVRLGQYKLVINFASGSTALYDLSRDPEETSPLPLGAAEDVRRQLLQHARRHLAESSQSRDFDRRVASQVREYRLELARSAAHFRET